MRVVAIVQARMGSTRLPGKVMMEIEGDTMLGRVVSRLRLARTPAEVAVATTTSALDDAVVAECRRLECGCFRGSEDDVLDRYVRAAGTFAADTVVRITSDCPMIDPVVVDTVVDAFVRHAPDYASNALDRSFPRGLDTEVMTRAALDRAGREASRPWERAHVTPYIYGRPDLFRLHSVRSETDRSALRWTVDTAEDLRFVREVYARLGGAGTFSWTEVLALLEREPALSLINAAVAQKELSQG